MTDIVERIKDLIELAESAQTHWDISRLKLEFKAIQPEVAEIGKRVRATFGKPIDDLDLYILAGDSHVGNITLYNAILTQQEKVRKSEQQAEKQRNAIKLFKNSSRAKNSQNLNNPNSSDISESSIAPRNSNGTSSPQSSQATLDVEVAKVVSQVSTRLHLERASTSTPKKQSTPSLSGKYWVGPPESRQSKLCYCRILNNNVMVRVGGGWDHLSTFLNRHFGYLATSPPDSPTNSRVVTPERRSPDHSFRSEGSMRELSLSLSPESIKQFLRKQGSS